MEQFALAAQHSGAITHNHCFHFNPSTVAIAKEARQIVAIIVVGWVAVETVRNLRLLRDSFKSGE